jgi:rhodanese-related sulfurtransferase
MQETDKLREMSVDQVASRLGQRDFFVVDNNEAGRWTVSHVPGAKNLNAAEYKQSDLPADKNTTLVFYCAGPG